MNMTKQEVMKWLATTSAAEREDIAARIGAVVTVEGRPLSRCNQALVAFQSGALTAMPTVVGGFRQWLRAGRCVEKGQHGLAIWYPRGGKKAAVEGEGADEEPGKGGSRSFGVGVVFDITQTVELKQEKVA
jgi:hypothetical protein